EVARLREQTNLIARLQSENKHLEAGSPVSPPPQALMTESESDEVLATETLQAMKNIAAALPAAMQAFAVAHNGQSPKRFSNLTKYFPISDGRRIPGLYNCAFVRDEGPESGDTLILEEAGSRLLPDGLTRERIYVFSDGTIVPVRHPNGLGDREFEAW